VAQRAAADSTDHLSYLLQLLELELLERERKAAERRLKAARFPTLQVPVLGSTSRRVRR
jgi:DNA replication protein DnaC